jgi:23S rRNA pseudouridine1911/1915/1917 synthase
MSSPDFTFTVEQSDAGRRLDEFLASRFGRLSRIRIARLVAGGACRLNNARAEAGQRISAGDLIEFSVVDAGPSAMTPEPIPLVIKFEDDQILVVEKPAGMLVHPTIGVKSGTLANAITYHLNQTQLGAGFDGGKEPAGGSGFTQPMIRPGIIHRLDRATSGLMVVAKQQQALGVLSRHFRKRLTKKRYIALVEGRVRDQSGTIEAPIGRDSERRPQWRVSDDGKPAETRYWVLDSFDKLTLLELEPVTGRTNQLRIHCAHIGHAIVGDEYYRSADSSASEPAEGVRNGRDANENSPGRLFLHASRLAFRHPRSGVWLEFNSSLPAELERFLAGLKRG